MNRPFQYLIIGSIAALLCAIVGALWLVWHSLMHYLVLYTQWLTKQVLFLQTTAHTSFMVLQTLCTFQRL